MAPEVDTRTAKTPRRHTAATGAAQQTDGGSIGTIVGGVVGLGVGAYNSVSEQDEELARCIRDKGYMIEAA